MRDPDLVVRAQQAATALESAWRRWRSMHGLGGEPPSPVSSYVGYSLEAPWGQARIVFGIGAEEAEKLAALLEHHDCVGPVHASVTARPVSTGSAGLDAGGLRMSGPGASGPGASGPGASGPGEPGQAVAYLDYAGSAESGEPAVLKADADGGPEASWAGPDQPDTAGLVHVPAPALASAGQWPLNAASPLTSPSVPDDGGEDTPIALAASRAVAASMARRRIPAPAESAEQAGPPTVSGPNTPDDQAPYPPAPEHDAGGYSAGEYADQEYAGPGHAGSGYADPEYRTAEYPGSDYAATESGEGQYPEGQYSERQYPGAPASSAAGLASGQAAPWTQPSPEGIANQAAEAAPRSPVHQGDTGQAAAAQTLVGGLPPVPAGSSDVVEFRPRSEPASPPSDWPQIQTGAPRAETASQGSSEITRAGRIMRGAGLSRIKRPGPGAVERGASPDDQRPAPAPGPDSRDRISSAAATADAATWGAGELPGQAAVSDTAV